MASSARRHPTPREVAPPAPTEVRVDRVRTWRLRAGAEVVGSGLGLEAAWVRAFRERLVISDLRGRRRLAQGVVIELEEAP